MEEPDTPEVNCGRSVEGVHVLERLATRINRKGNNLRFGEPGERDHRVRLVGWLQQGPVRPARRSLGQRSDDRLPERSPLLVRLLPPDPGERQHRERLGPDNSLEQRQQPRNRQSALRAQPPQQLVVLVGVRERPDHAAEPEQQRHDSRQRGESSTLFAQSF